jgi:hypothetical protein
MHIIERPEQATKDEFAVPAEFVQRKVEAVQASWVHRDLCGCLCGTKRSAIEIATGNQGRAWSLAIVLDSQRTFAREADLALFCGDLLALLSSCHWLKSNPETSFRWHFRGCNTSRQPDPIG